MVSDYGLNDRPIGVRFPAGTKDFFSLCVQRALRPTQPLVQWVPGVLSPGGKARPGRDADHSPHLVPRLRMSRSYTSSPPKRHHGVLCSHLPCVVSLPFSSCFKGLNTVNTIVRSERGGSPLGCLFKNLSTFVLVFLTRFHALDV
jgi:hypothetical protein